jgi:hypothetical protein
MTRSQETRLKKLEQVRSARRRRYVFHDDEVAEAKAQGLPYILVLTAIGAPHIGERSEKELIAAFVDKIAALKPRLVTFNGASFDLPVLRYRAMLHRLSAPGLEGRPYFKRYTDDATDLCDVLSSFDSRSKMKLNDLCRVLNLPGKPDGIDGSQVETAMRAVIRWRPAGAAFSPSANS